MCGRFSQFQLSNAFFDLFHIEIDEDFTPNKNVFPGQNALVVLKDQKTGRLKIKNSFWGYLPGWADPIKYKKVINARIETLHDKPYFKSTVKNKRCVIPVNGFYEWNQGNQKKEGYYFTKRGDSLFYLAGLYDATKNNPDKESFCIITKQANEEVLPVHDRMPLIVSRKDILLWLDGSEEILIRKQKPSLEAVGLLMEPIL